MEKPSTLKLTIFVTLLSIVLVCSRKSIRKAAFSDKYHSSQPPLGALEFAEAVTSVAVDADAWTSIDSYKLTGYIEQSKCASLKEIDTCLDTVTGDKVKEMCQGCEQCVAYGRKTNYCAYFFTGVLWDAQPDNANWTYGGGQQYYFKYTALSAEDKFAQENMVDEQCEGYNEEKKCITDANYQWQKVCYHCNACVAFVVESGSCAHFFSAIGGPNANLQYDAGQVNPLRSYTAMTSYDLDTLDNKYLLLEDCATPAMKHKVRCMDMESCVAWAADDNGCVYFFKEIGGTSGQGQKYLVGDKLTWYELKPCEVPQPIPGYDFSSASGQLERSDAFNPTGVTCSPGYYGVVSYEMCEWSGEAYKVSGCEAWGGSCPNGELKNQSLRTHDDDCGECNFGYVMDEKECVATTTTTTTTTTATTTTATTSSTSTATTSTTATTASTTTTTRTCV